MAALVPFDFDLNSTECDPVDAIDGDANWPANSLDVIYGVTIFSALLSLLGSLFIIVTYHSIYGSRLAAQLFRAPWLAWLYCGRAGGAAVLAPASTEILYWMSFCDAVLDIAYIVDASAVDHRTPKQHAACPGGWLAAAPRDGALCPLLGATSQFFGLGVVLWTGVLAANMFAAVRRRSAAASAEGGAAQQAKWLRQCHWVVWILAGATVLMLVPVHGLGSAGHVCWIADNAAPARALFFYLPLVAVLCFTIFTYAKLRRTLAILLVHGGARATPGAPAPPPAGGHPAGGGHVLAALSRRFGSYVLVFMVVWTFPILNRVHNAFDPDHPLYTLFIGSALFAPMQGLGNAIIYGWTPSVRDHYRVLLCRPAPARRTTALPLASNSMPGRHAAGSGSSRSISDGEMQLVCTGGWTGGGAQEPRSGAHGSELGGVGGSGGRRAPSTKYAHDELHVTDNPL
mmetsp:Transcript_10147/g.33484  ORF Transcript_10147/g.33484 Transcript_10147/m.33484 type:complete len:457 (-) Transcript_10147:216-1586(-)